MSFIPPLELRDFFSSVQMVQDEVCPFAVKTFTFGYINDDEDMFIDSLTHRELFFEAINRGLQPDLDIGVLCQNLHAQIPSIAWQKRILLWYTHLSKSDKELVDRYTSYGFRWMNKDLIEYPDDDAEINEIIASAPPFDQDVIVYHYIDRSQDIPVEGAYEIHGYFSTSFSASFIVQGLCEEKGDTPEIMFRIRVPAGTKCLYIPSHEYELLFPHKTRLVITDRHIETFVCKLEGMYQRHSEDRLPSTVDLMVYDALMLP